MKTLLLIFSSFVIIAQQVKSQIVENVVINSVDKRHKIDSLQNLLLQAKKDTDKATILLQIGVHYRTLNGDSSLLFLQQSYALSQKAKDTSNIISAAIKIVDQYALRGNFPQAIELALKTRHLAELTRDTMSLFWATRAVWRGYSQMLGHEKTLEYTRKVKAIVQSGFFKTDIEKNDML